MGNLLSGLAATVPNTTYSSSVSVTDITGVASRTVGVYIGAIFLVLAFLPKFMGLILAIPGPVAGAYTIVIMSILFVLGMRVVVEDGVDYRKGMVAGVGFWVGLGFQNGLIFGDQLGAWSGLLENGMTAGGLAAILMTLFLELSRSRPHRLRTALKTDAYPAIDTFLTEFAGTRGWSEEMTDRLRAVGEETLLTLIRQDEESGKRRLQISARNDGRAAELEFVAATDESNIEDRMAVLGIASPASGPSRRSRCGCFGTSPRRCATSSTTKRTS